MFLGFGLGGATFPLLVFRDRHCFTSDVLCLPRRCLCDLPSRRPSRVTRPSCALIASLCALQRRKDKLPVSKLLLGFFMFVIFGSTLLQLINKVAK